ncbi:MAG TPA: cyanophycinase [Cytophagales bacterium]|nr:cyanophycinase [Cytophagales bacterium]
MKISVANKTSAFILVITILLICCTSKNTSHNPKIAKGTLVIIGGGNRDTTLMQELINVSGWKQGDWISIATMASRWDSAYLSMNNEFRFYTKSNVRCIRIDSITVKNKLVLDSMRQSKIIYLTGGDQSVFMNHIRGTAFKKMINGAYQSGVTIAGTSAGAALMSERMLTGNQLESKEYTSTVKVIHNGNMEIAEGLGLLSNVIIDQHFIVRSRTNRLLSAVLSNQGLDGIGIDESTAIIIRDTTARVAGLSQVMVYRSPNQLTHGKNKLVGTPQLNLSVYLPGEKFIIKH